jgi:hypothetical protein
MRVADDLEAILCEQCKKQERVKTPGSRKSHTSKQFKTLAVSNVVMRQKINEIPVDNKGHYMQVFEKVKQRHEMKRLRLPRSYIKQHMAYEP